MEGWSPFRKEHPRPDPVPRHRGRRRLHLPAAGNDPDAILTDRDAAHAAAAARTSRVLPARPGWELYGSQPVTPAPAVRDPDDRVLRLGQAAEAAQAVIMGQAVPAVRAADGGAYGTGPAYDPARMR